MQHWYDHALYDAYQSLADIFITSTYLLSSQGTIDFQIFGSIQTAVPLSYQLEIFVVSTLIKFGIRLVAMGSFMPLLFVI